MTDNVPAPEGTPKTTPPDKKSSAGKVVVMLSSVAKAPPAGTQSMTPMATPTTVNRPPPLPVKVSSQVRALPLPVNKAKPPPLPARTVEPVKTENKKTSAIKIIPPIKLNQPSPTSTSSEESIFAPDKEPEALTEAAPKGWKSLEPGELEPVPGDLQSMDVFARSQRPPDAPKPAPASPATKPEDKKAEPAATPPPITAKTAEPVSPPPLPAKPAASPVPHHAPPLLANPSGAPAEKLPAPHLPGEVKKEETPPVLLAKPHDPTEWPGGAHKAPAMIPSESSSPVANKPPALPSQSPPAPHSTSSSKVTGPITLRGQATPVVVSSTAKPPPLEVSKKADDGKPALRPPVLPNKTLAQPKVSVVETAKPAVDAAPKSTVETTSIKPPVTPMALPVTPAKKAPLPLSRAERAKKRRLMETVVFYLVFAITVTLLVVGAFYFGRETDVEGQLIPPPGMALNDEAWIVNDFHELSSGIAEDLTNERVPLKQEIQERLDHVQRVQADVATREERIRLLQQQIQAAKDSIANVVKQSRDATQQLWDGPGAELDDEYNSKLDELQKAIADRAKLLNLKYEPDTTYRSPEVWANAFRLALYGVPPGIDTGQQHQWLGEQMKKWRDFQKSLDDRKEQLREQAAQLKVGPAPKIADLNTKIDDLQHHIDSTLAEEEPLKAELQQAQSDLVQDQVREAGLDDKYFKQLYTLPEGSIVGGLRMPVATNGRFTWLDVDKSKPFVEGEKEHFYWIFARATRADGRQYWALYRFAISKNETLQMVIEPSGFISTKAILRPELSPDEQAQ